MSDIGVEVGQKMRLAIKAKLTELKCYADDELPDYIMVMIANKRTKAQMKDDLSLFLRNETSFFVEWLHIVLKKLKQVQVTNPNVFKAATKRQSNECILGQEDSKKVKKEGNVKKEKYHVDSSFKSLTDDLPMNANNLSRRKIVLLDASAVNHNAHEDDFDIPLLSEISTSNEEQLLELEKKIKAAKSRLELNAASDEDDENGCGEYLSIKPDPIDMDFAEPTPPIRNVIVKEINAPSIKKSIHSRITFNKDEDSLHSKYEAILRRTRPIKSIHEEKSKPRSIRDRLGKRSERVIKENYVGMQSEVKIPPKRHQPDVEVEIDHTKRDVASVITVKPRKLPAKAKQANASLLFKAMAEAQRSIRQNLAPAVEKKPETSNLSAPALFTKSFREQELAKSKLRVTKAQIPARKESFISAQLKDRLGEQKTEKITRKIEIVDEAKPQLSEGVVEQNGGKQQFIVTLDGIDKTKYSHVDKASKVEEDKKPTRKTPSPIIFTQKVALVSKLNANEKCKYYPNCRQGKRCEYVHPIACKMFPNCKFGEKCAYEHPMCKFEMSCTRKSCPFRHMRNAALPTASNAAICKFFPNCTKDKCPYIHPKVCKFGVYCKKFQCPFEHV